MMRKPLCSFKFLKQDAPSQHARVAASHLHIAIRQDGTTVRAQSQQRRFKTSPPVRISFFTSAQRSPRRLKSRFLSFNIELAHASFLEPVV